ncbi:MAG: hypothetical protein CSA75_00240 [Sorangium cellulosum]|nr:MAG: hypothetical protein CSA75_00240 [Sorangium cellulosum]
MLDGGRCPGGLESTVVDVRSEPGSILRSGAVAAERLGIDFDNTTGSRPTVLDGKRLDQEWLDGPWLHVGAPESFDQWAKDQGVTVGRIVVGGEGLSEGVWRLPADLEGYASQMYDVLHDLWSARVCRVWIDAPSTELSWGPIWDRITRLVGSLEAPCSILWH